MPNEEVIFDKATNILEVYNLKNGLTGAYLNAATVTADVVDEDDVQVTGVSWPFTLTYVPSSNGTYRAALPSTAGFTRDAWYKARITIDGGSDLQDYREVRCVCRVRGAT